jgi:metal-responsive CopG/Arc/MetJ family transcriptional regulator
MNAAKITISLNQNLLNHLDLLVQSHVFPSRSQAIQAAVQEKIARLQKTRLAAQCALLDPIEEQSLADMGLSADGDQWPEY